MKRRLFNLLAGVSLLLCAATVILWGRSYRHDDSITLRHLPNETLVYCFEGKLLLQVDESWPTIEDLHNPRSTWGREYKKSFAGFGFEGGYLRHFDAATFTLSSSYMKWWFLPLWFMAFVFLIPPAWWIIRLTCFRLTPG